MSRRRPVGAAVGLAVLLALAAGCSSEEGEAPVGPPPLPAASTGGGVPTPTRPTPTSEPTSGPGSGTPTATTLPPPPPPSGPAPSTAGSLSAASLPVPAGWRTVEPPGNDEIGQPGNGTWVQALDPRYAAQGALSVGCADVTGDGRADPTAALEGGYESRTGVPGVGLALEFATDADAAAFWSAYVRGVRACAGADGAVSTAGIREPAVPGGQGLVDRRTDETQDPTDWTEVGALRGRRVVLVNLGDPGHRMGPAAADALLARLRT